MVIRMTKESPVTGLGIAEIDGVKETISAGIARRMAGENSVPRRTSHFPRGVVMTLSDVERLW